jgi:hypothetical protein
MEILPVVGSRARSVGVGTTGGEAEGSKSAVGLRAGERRSVFTQPAKMIRTEGQRTSGL